LRKAAEGFSGGSLLRWRSACWRWPKPCRRKAAWLPPFSALAGRSGGGRR